MGRSYDVVVVGCGSMGSATVYELARRGLRVLGIDRFHVPHEMGSHTGQSRIIRKAYFEHPDYVPLLESAYRGWSEFESVIGEKIYTETGLLYSGLAESPLIRGVIESSGLYGIPVQNCTGDALARLPAFRLPDEHVVLFEPGAGFIRPEQVIAAYVRTAQNAGADFLFKEPVVSWRKEGDGMVVQTNAGSILTDRLVVTAGAWTSYVLPALADKLKVTRQTIAWFHTRQPERFAPEHFPCWLLDEHTSGDVFYGFPQLNPDAFGAPAGLKIALHNPGQPVDPDHCEREVSEQEAAKMQSFMDRYMPGQRVGISMLKSCLYTYSPDEHFVIDVLPDSDGKVVVAAGFSGHGFKFVPVIGQILADLAIQGATTQPAGFLSMARFNP